MTRYEKILTLTIYELHFYLENPSHLRGVSELFARGGFHVLSDDELDELYKREFGNIEGENHGS